MFDRTADGQVAKGTVWPGFCAFTDYTSARVREWWGELYVDLYNETGLSGFWNDMNEPAEFHVNHKTLTDSVLHEHDGHLCSHRNAHNIYAQQMCRASWDALKKLQTQQRPYLLTRPPFSGRPR